MKKTALFFLAAVAAAALSADQPRIVAQEKKLDDGRTTYSKRIFLNEGSVELVYTTRDGVKMERKKYGEAFFGFRNGGLPHFNGGWSQWDFFRCFEYKNGVHNVFAARAPKSVDLKQVNGVAILDLVYPGYYTGEVKIRMMQFPQYKDWTFIRVAITGFDPWRLDFIAYPYKSDMPKERQRFMRYPQKDVEITQTKQRHNFVPEDPFIVLYNKKVQETAGNFLIFEPEKVKTVEGVSYGAGSEIRMIVQKGVPVFHYALGSFKNKPYAEAINSFFGEEGDKVRKFMDEINWDLKPAAAKK